MIRGLIMAALWIAAIAVAVVALNVSAGWWILAAVLAALAGLGTWDLLQKSH